MVYLRKKIEAKRKGSDNARKEGGRVFERIGDRSRERRRDSSRERRPTSGRDRGILFKSFNITANLCGKCFMGMLSMPTSVSVDILICNF